jgi:hypothetical protein
LKIAGEGGGRRIARSIVLRVGLFIDGMHSQVALNLFDLLGPKILREENCTALFVSLLCYVALFQLMVELPQPLLKLRILSHAIGAWDLLRDHEQSG